MKMTDELADQLRNKLRNIISGYRINEDDAGWLEGLMAARLAADQQKGGEMNPWQFAVDQGRVVAHLGIAADNVTREEAIRQLGELIDWHVAVALDPAVNGGFVLTPQPSIPAPAQQDGKWMPIPDESARTAPPSAPVGVEGLPKPFGYVEPRHDLSGYEVFDEPGPRRAAIWNMHGMRKALAQTRAPYSIDADPDGIRARVADAITGALAFGAQGNHKPPAGHWLAPFWDMARAEAQAQGGGEVAPSIEAAEAMGASGGPASESERLAFEAWMRGHCWALCATWDGSAYTSDAEQGGGYCPNAARTRMQWAAWRDRAALSTPASHDAQQPQCLHADGGYLIVYDDADMQPEAFALSGARDAALDRFEQISVNWNAHLYAKIKSNSRYCEVPDALAQQPAVVGDGLTACPDCEGYGGDQGGPCARCQGIGRIAALTPAAAPGDELYRDDWISQAEMDQRLEHLAEEYEWYGDEWLTIGDRERRMLIDFAHGIMADDVFVAMMKAHHDPNAKGRPAQKEGNGNG